MVLHLFSPVRRETTPRDYNWTFATKKINNLRFLAIPSNLPDTRRAIERFVFQIYARDYNIKQRTRNSNGPIVTTCLKIIQVPSEHKEPMFTSDSDKSIRSDFSSVTLSEDRLTTSSPPSSSLNTISSSELHASSPAAPPSSLAWGITSAVFAAITATLV